MTGYAVNSIGSYANDPYFAYALNSYNPNFTGTQSSVSQPQATSAPANTSSSTNTSANLPMADYSEESHTGTVAAVLGLGVSAALLIGAYKKGKGTGEGLTRIKNGFKKIFGMDVNNIDNVVKNTNKATESLKGIKVVMKNNKPVYYIPGKTEKITDSNQIANIIKEKEMHKLTGLRFKTGETTVSAGTFNIKGADGKINTIKFDGDKIIKIENEAGNDITSIFVENNKFRTDLTCEQDTFANKIQDFISKIKQGDAETVLGKDTNLRDFTYTTKIGDNSAVVTRKSISAQANSPEVKEITRLKEFDADSKEVIAEVRRQRENGNNIDSIIAESFVKKGKLPEGYKVAEFEIKDGSYTIKVLDGKPVSITNNGKLFNKDSDEFLAYMEKYEKSVNKKIQNELKDNKIPKGAIICPV